MGWSSGSELYSVVVDVLRGFIPDEAQRTEAHKRLIEAFRDHDWDTEDECRGVDPAYNKALDEIEAGR